VKNTGWRFAASNSIWRACSGLWDSGIGGMASIWVLGGGGEYVGVNVEAEGVECGVEERGRVGCWFIGGVVD